MLRTSLKTIGTGLAAAFVVALSFPLPSAMALPGDTLTTPTVIPELPIEIETEVGPAGSLKQVPLFKEILELLENPPVVTCLADDPMTPMVDEFSVCAAANPDAIVCPPDDPLTLQFDESSECIATTERREGFGNAMPDLNVFNPCFNVITGQPLRMRPDGEISWDQPGLLFDPDEQVSVGPGNIPDELRTPIGSLVTCPTPPGTWANPCEDDEFEPPHVAPAGALVVNNPGGKGVRKKYGFGGDEMGQGWSDSRIPPHRTIVAELACNADGQLIDEDGLVVTELEQPVNESHFIEDRLAAEVLGKALFWDMQIGSDIVQACGSCHFQSGIDVRTRNQLNPNTTGGDVTLQITGPNMDVVATDFPFHKLVDNDLVGEPMLNPGNVVSDANDVMSSMGVSTFQLFLDVPIEDGTTGPAFGPPGPNGVKSLLPDLGTPMPDPILSQTDMDGNKLRRIEPRHTPTMHAAAFNFDNFWDGRARHDYNGGSVQGASDPFFHVYVSCEDEQEYQELRPLPAPAEAELGPEGLCEWTEEFLGFDAVDELGAPDPQPPVPVRIRFSSLASQTQDPPLSPFEMSFAGRNWQKIGKKLLQAGVVPLANQLVAIDDSRMGPYSNQNLVDFCSTAEAMAEFGAPVVGKPGLCISYPDLIKLAFRTELWSNDTQRLDGAAAVCTAPADLGVLTPASCDPFDGYVIEINTAGPANPLNTSQFTQMEANFSLFFGQSVQAYEQLLIPDDTPWDQFNDANNNRLGLAIGQPGEQGTIPIFSDPGADGIPGTEDDIIGIREAITGDPMGSVVLVPGFGPDELFGADIFMGGNMTAALPLGLMDPVSGVDRNPDNVGSNPFIRTARCMLCHLGPEQTDHTNNVNAGLLQSGTEREFPFPNTGEPTGKLRIVTGFALAEELEENAQDGVEVENRDFAILDVLVDDALTPLDESLFEDQVIAVASGIAFQDNGIYNIGLRPSVEDMLRGDPDVFGWPKALSALALKNLGGEAFEPCDNSADVLAHPEGCAMTNFDPDDGVGGGLFEEVGEGFPFSLFDSNTLIPDAEFYEQESINPGLETEPEMPQLPAYLAPWANNLPAGEGHPQTDELAFVPNTLSPPPSPEYGEILFGSDSHCGIYDPDEFGAGVPNFGWGPRCPQSQSAVPGNSPNRLSVDSDGVFDPGFMELPLNGTWPWVNRVARDGAAKVPHLRNVELTGPYFHTGSYLTLRQVVDFYIRGGDFPITSKEDRDPNLVNIDEQAFGFGTTIGLPVEFQDGIPDAVALYGVMPDTNPPNCTDDLPGGCTPEPATSTPEQAKMALVKFMIALTDERVAFKRAPFDQPEIFPPIDGRAPANTFGRTGLLARSGVACPLTDDTQGTPDPFTGTCFLQVSETGEGGAMTRSPGFLGTSSVPPAPNFFEDSVPGALDHFDRVSEPGVAFP